MTYCSFLLVLALAILCAWAPVRGGDRSTATPGGREALVTAARELVPPWMAFLLLDLGLVVRRIEADEDLLSLVSLITLFGGYTTWDWIGRVGAPSSRTGRMCWLAWRW